MKGKHFETSAIRDNVRTTQEREHSAAIFMSSSFLFDSAEDGRKLFAEEMEGNTYSRYTNPNVDAFASRLASLEGTEAGIGVASGMAAIFAVCGGLCQAGDHIVSCRQLFGSTSNLFVKVLPRFGIASTFVDSSKPETWEAAFTPKTKIFFAETPSNPLTELADIAFAAEICRKKGVLLVVDNCVATAYLQKPVDLGADLVAYSATKFIDGQGRAIGGAVVGKKDPMRKIRDFARTVGVTLSPFNAWIFYKSLETLGPRMDRHCSNALELSRFLEGSAGVKRVFYPFLSSHPQYELAQRQMRGGGALLGLEIDGDRAAAMKFIDRLTFVSRSPNLGDCRTVATHPATTTHSGMTPAERAAAGISDSLIRISVGLEHVDDLKEEFSSALGR